VSFPNEVYILSGFPAYISHTYSGAPVFKWKSFTLRKCKKYWIAKRVKVDMVAEPCFFSQKVWDVLCLVLPSSTKSLYKSLWWALSIIEMHIIHMVLLIKKKSRVCDFVKQNSSHQLGLLEEGWRQPVRFTNFLAEMRFCCFGSLTTFIVANVRKMPNWMG
jgi:hypothetical protein